MTGAVVTGIGVVAPTGIGVDAHWSATLAGKSALNRITRFDPAGYPATVAGEIRDFYEADHVPSQLRVQTDRWTQFGLAAAQLALDDAGVDPASLPSYEMAVVTASSSGGNEFGQREIERLWTRGPGFVTAYQSIAWFYAATTGQVSIRHGMRGPCGVVVSEQAGGLDALDQARLVIEEGARVALTGGVEAPLCPYAFLCQLASGMLSPCGDPARAYLPFDEDASGHVPGEGGAILLVEDEAAARGRGARIHGRIAGHTATFDPAPGADRSTGLRRAIEGALADARIPASEIGVVFADAAGVPAADRLESEAIAAVFGRGAVPVTAPKTATGRLYAGGGALDVATALLCLRDRVIPPTVNVSRPAFGRDLDLVRGEPRETRAHAVLVLARGYGGFNSAVVLTAAG